MYALNNIEKKQNIKFPEEYKRLYQSDFEEFSNRLEFHFWGYDIILITETDYEGR